MLATFVGVAQHKAYQDCLGKLGVRIVSLPAEPELPDAVFVEDAAIVLDELAVISRMGAPSRRPEASTLVETLSHYRPIKLLAEPATLDGGDVLIVDRSVFVGLSQRTNREGFAQLINILRAYNYELHPIEVRGCLHLKSACSYVGNNAMLVNRSWIDAEQLRRFELIDVPAGEPAGANALLIDDVVIIPAYFPETAALVRRSFARRRLEKRGFRVRTVDLSELQKAEASVTCCALIFASHKGH